LQKESFEVFITADQSIFYQQNNSNRKIALVVLDTNHWGRISKEVGLVSDAVNFAVPSGFVFIEFKPITKKTHTSFRAE